MDTDEYISEEYTYIYIFIYMFIYMSWQEKKEDVRNVWEALGGNKDGNDCIYFVSIADLSEFLKE